MVSLQKNSTDSLESVLFRSVNRFAIGWQASRSLLFVVEDPKTQD